MQNVTQTGDRRFTWGLVCEVFAVLERHGYQEGEAQHVGRAIGLLGDLVEVYEDPVPLTPEQQRSARARNAARARWSREDARPTTLKAQAGFLARFEREVDPNGDLPAAERTRRAKDARRAYMAGLAKTSAAARSARKSLDEQGGQK